MGYGVDRKVQTKGTGTDYPYGFKESFVLIQALELTGPSGPSGSKFWVLYFSLKYLSAIEE